MSTSMSTSLADQLRRRSDADLGALLRARVDLAVPAPADFAALATRAQSRLSVARALEGLDQFGLEVLDAVRLAAAGGAAGEPGTAALPDLVAMATEGGGATPEQVRQAVDRLRALAVAYGPDEAIALVTVIDDLCSPF